MLALNIPFDKFFLYIALVLNRKNAKKLKGKLRKN